VAGARIGIGGIGLVDVLRTPGMPRPQTTLDGVSGEDRQKVKRAPHWAGVSG